MARSLPPNPAHDQRHTVPSCRAILHVLFSGHLGHTMSHPSPKLLLLLATLIGCGSQQGVNQTATRPQSASTAGSEILVRSAIARVLKADASSIQMDRPISDPPLKADELSFVEIIMELEDRAGISIDEEIMDRHGGKLGDGPIKVTPNQLVKMVEDAPKAAGARPRR